MYNSNKKDEPDWLAIMQVSIQLTSPSLLNILIVVWWLQI